MSGPKVVRIVTREEITAACKDVLAQLESEVRRWERVGKRNDLLSDDDIDATRKRQAEIEALLATDRFEDLQKQAPAQIAYLQANMAERLNEAASKAASARLQERRLAALAGQTLARTDIVLPPDLYRDLEAIARGQSSSIAQAENALASVLALTLDKVPNATSTPAQDERAKRLGGNEPAVSLQEWLKANTPEPEAIAVKLERAIEELRQLGADAASASFSDRHVAIRDEASKSRRQMLVDTLMLDVSKALTDVRRQVEQLGTLEQRAAPLRNLESADAKELQHKVAVAVAKGDLASAGQLLKQVDACLDSERRILAAKAQRSAILSALKDLGYEVREGMETAAPKEGHVTLRRAANPNMGVQITGVHSSERIQMRPVRFGVGGSAGDKSKDRDIETMWCTDFDRLKGKIGAGYGSLKIEQAHAVGAVPVLFVDDGPPPDDRRPEVRRPAGTRTLE